MSGALPRDAEVAHQAQRLSNGFDSAHSLAACNSQKQKFFPLSFSQQQLWYVCQYQGGTVAYNQPVAWRLSGTVDIDAMQQSFRSIIARHEALRTVFRVVDGIAQQCVHSSVPFALRVVDLRGVSSVDRSTRTEEVLLEEARYPFNLAQELLLRAALVQTSDNDFLFIITVHHMVCDGWSMGVLIEELCQLYAGFSTGKIPELRQVSVQYPEFAVAQREQVRPANLERNLAYWKDRLQGAEVLQLPTDYLRLPARRFRGASQPVRFPSELTAAFKALAAGEEVFFFMGLLAALQVLLHRYTGQTDIVVGAPVASRKRARLQRSIGLYLNLIALRTDLSGDPTFRQLLRQVRDTVMAAYQHQDLPFEQVVEAIRPVRDPSRNPVFQVILDQVDPRWIALNLQGARADWFPVDNGTSKYDLTLAWSESPEGLRGWIEYDTDLFTAGTIERMLGHYQQILASVVANPDQQISQTTLLTDAELQQITVEWNATQAEYPQVCIHELFERQAEKTPEAIAVQSGESSFAYSELNRKANQVARHLEKHGIGARSLVGVCLDRTCDLPVALLAVLKTGAAYVPLDPSYPQARLTFMLEDSRLSLLLTQQDYAGKFTSVPGKVVCLDAAWGDILAESGQNGSARISPDDPAYVIYTSGSSGRPKGVVGLHRGALNRFAWMWRSYPFERGEVACAKTSLSFVDSIWELFGPLLAGVRTILIPSDTARNPRDLIATLARHSVTRLVLVPSLLQAMLESEPTLGESLPQLRYWISSGEALNARLMDRFRERVPHGILLNLYGSSEVSADVTCYDTRLTQSGDIVLAGRPISNTQIYVLDANLRPVPVGIAGQLCVSGDGLAEGYLNRPELTAKKFAPSPFKAQSRIYLTGDLARFRSDGNIDLLGRIDRQVKIRGYRIELEEIESLLARHPSVKQCALTCCEQNNRRLVTYLVPKPDELYDRNEVVGSAVQSATSKVTAPQTCDSSSLACASNSIASPHLVQCVRQFLQAQLPDYMVPSDFVILQSLPLTPNGKIDWRALPASGSSQREVAMEYVAPRTRAEHMIAEVWRDLLQLEQVGTRDNFFDLGGHSLLLGAAHIRLSKAFNLEIPSTDLYQYPTISALAARLSDSAQEQRPLSQAAMRAARQRESRLRRTSTLHSSTTQKILRTPQEDEYAPD